MLNNFIGGGQVFLHKLRMFSQVFVKSLQVSLLTGILSSFWLNWENIQKVDWDGFYSYRKAVIVMRLDEVFSDISSTIGNSSTSDKTTYINVKSKGRVWRDINPYKVIHLRLFQQADKDGWNFILGILLLTVIITTLSFTLIFLLWNKFGRTLKAEKKKEGSGEILTAKQVRKKLKSLKKASDFKIGDMPLVKDMETRHFLITGSTGSGKTNLMHNLLPQIEAKGQPAVVIDNTGEMIAKYYNPDRGDIIFNPFDQRSMAWDFWADCESNEEQERFVEILMSFNRKQSGEHSDRFWQIAASDVLNSSIDYGRHNKLTIEQVVDIACHSEVNHLKNLLSNSKATPHLSDSSKHTAASVISVMAAYAKPLKYLQSNRDAGVFSIKEYFNNIDNGSSSWLFLSTKPSSRLLTLPLISCLLELALAGLIDIDINEKRRIWIIIDELPSVGKLPSLLQLMAEGRKYGACVVAGLQSLNQLYDNYGYHAGSAVFGQFGTSFFFKNTEPAIAKMISSMCGTEIISRYQKSTSFGANTFRDGVSYNEHQQKKALIEASDLASLAVGECYTLFSDIAGVRLSKIQVPKIYLANKNKGFIQRKKTEQQHIQQSKAYSPCNVDNIMVHENNDNQQKRVNSNTGSNTKTLANKASKAPNTTKTITQEIKQSQIKQEIEELIEDVKNNVAEYDKLEM